MESNKNLVENPNTAIVSESESEAVPSKKTTPTRRRRRRKDRRFEPNFDIPGVRKLVLEEFTQNSIGCVAGDTVTAERPWTNIEKEVIVDHLDLHADSSEFLPIKNEVMEYPGNEFLIGYIPDESRDFDEFYICLTEEATETVNEIIDKLKRIQEERLKNAIHRKIKRWKPLGSDKEVEEGIVKDHRSLIEVEIESKYPILPFKIQFRLIKAEDLRDGYMELRPSDEALATIFRRRVDAFVQVAPSVVANEAQTVCTYPRNSYTQYEYVLPEVDVEDSEKYVKDFISENMESFCDILKVNGCIDLYSNDYENLVLNDKYAKKVATPEAREYFCFIEMNLCGGKMISSVAWHPMWTGCLILSYVDIAPPLYITTKLTSDEVLKAIHDTNPVLFWSFDDDLKPKLILETPRRIYSLSCCPYDANLIIGGCINGQIILWDITHKLEHVEIEEILTVEQQKYREYMFSLMNWMKNISDAALVRPTAISDLKYSHKGCVNSISWMSPFHSVSKTGKIEQLQDDAPHSLQLITSAEDGTVMIWDLRKKPVVTPGGFKAIRRVRRLKKRPSALSVLESPFKMLHLNLKPIYKINVINPVENNRLIGIASCHTNFFKTVYEPSTRESRKKVKLIDRQIFQPVLNLYNSSPRKTFYAGTMEGDFIQGTWEGQEFDSGEIVNFEDCQFINRGKFHDGPIVSIDYAPVLNTILTVGGKLFALWREDFKDQPVLWRKSKSIYTNGSWFTFEQASIKLIRMDGYLEIWTLFYQSKSPLQVALTSNGAVNIISSHPRKLKNNVFGLSDYRGSLRLFYTTHSSPLVVRAKEENMSGFLTLEIQRKKAFLKWQREWNQRHVVTHQVVEEEPDVMITEPTETKKKEEKKKIVRISPGQRYLETVQEQHRINEQERIKSIILTKKQLNTEELLKRREPLRKLEEENEIKRRKQKNKLKESDKIFKDTVAMLFPDVVKEKPPPPPDPYEDCYSDDNKNANFSYFQNLSIGAQDYVEEHPFSYDFSWRSVLKTGRERRRKLDDSAEKESHRKRYAQIKDQKAREAAEALAVAEAAEAARMAAMEEMSISSSISRSTFAPM
jgi:WD40 repeat protein